MNKLSQKIQKPININDPSLRDYTVFIPKSPDAFEEFRKKYYSTKGKTMIYPNEKKMREMAERIEDHFYVPYLDEVNEYDFDFALAIDPDQEHIHSLFHVKGNYFLISLYEIYEVFFNAFVPEFKYCPECGTKVAPSKLICPKCGSKFNKTND